MQYLETTSDGARWEIVGDVLTARVDQPGGILGGPRAPERDGFECFFVARHGEYTRFSYRPKAIMSPSESPDPAICLDMASGTHERANGLEERARSCRRAELIGEDEYQRRMDRATDVRRVAQQLESMAARHSE